VLNVSRDGQYGHCTTYSIS